MKIAQDSSAEGFTFNNVAPNQLESKHIAEMLAGYKNFVHNHLRPLSVELGVALQSDLTVPEQDAVLAKFNQAAKGIFKACRDNEIVKTTLMYYSGTNVELPDAAECIEIVDVNLSYFPGYAVVVITPVWWITPSSDNVVSIDGHFVGICDGIQYFVTMAHDGYIVTRVTEHPNAPDKISSQYVAKTSSYSPSPDTYDVKAVQRARAMGFLTDE